MKVAVALSLILVDSIFQGFIRLEIQEVEMGAVAQPPASNKSGKDNIVD